MIDVQRYATGVTLGEHGLWQSIETADISYPSDGNSQCFNVEEKSFWFTHRNKYIIQIVNRFPPEIGGVIFDIGGGNGFVATGLQNAGFNVVLVEPGLSGALNGQSRGLKTVVCATAESAGFKPDSLSAVGLFDVLEHIEDDIGFLKLLHNKIKKDGRIYLTVPANKFLWSQEDINAGHYRRYNLKSLRNALQSANFQIDFSDYFFNMLPLPIFFLRVLPYRLGYTNRFNSQRIIQREHGVNKGVLARIAKNILATELKKIEKHQLKTSVTGASCVIVATKI